MIDAAFLGQVAAVAIYHLLLYTTLRARSALVRRDRAQRRTIEEIGSLNLAYARFVAAGIGQGGVQCAISVA